MEGNAFAPGQSTGSVKQGAGWKLPAMVALTILLGAAAYLYLTKDKADDGAPVVVQTPLADDTVVIYEPLPEQQGITSPLTVRGKARGTWFFEAVFPVVLTDWDGRIIAQTQAHATTDWMTTDFVEFEATLTFDTPVGPGKDQPNRGFLILKKDNPSDLPEHDDSREIALFFAK